jgi:hypothetical protein
MASIHRQGRKGKGKDLKSVRYDIIQQTLASFLILFTVKKNLSFPWRSWRLGVSKIFPSAFSLCGLCALYVRSPRIPEGCQPLAGG